MYGLILAGGYGTRLRPMTFVTSKQLLPIYDKPMIYYPLSLMMAAGIRDYSIITVPNQADSFRNLLGDGSQWGIALNYIVQERPNGIPEVFTLARKKIIGKSTLLMLGDNIIYGSQIGQKISANSEPEGAHIYAYLVNDVSKFGTLVIKDNKILSLEEKPKNIKKGLAIPGLYHFNAQVCELVEEIQPSYRGELEIVDLLKIYLQQGMLTYSLIDRGNAWLDTGTVEDMFSAAELVKVIQSRQGMLIGSPEEVAFRKGWITDSQLVVLAKKYIGSSYSSALINLIED
jgi:glucose-1-phosphate thymidylyltransferase